MNVNVQEIARRLDILNRKEVPKITTSMLRSGGIQGRLHRREVKRFSQDIKRQKEKLHSQLDLINRDDFGISVENFEPRIEPILSPFNEPKLKRIRSRRGFF